MFGKDARLSTLASRKHLLIVESEANRHQLAQECAVVREHADVLRTNATSWGRIAGSVSAVAATFAALRGKSASPEAPVKTSLIGKIWKGAKMAGSLYMSSRMLFRG